MYYYCYVLLTYIFNWMRSHGGEKGENIFVIFIHKFLQIYRTSTLIGCLVFPCRLFIGRNAEFVTICSHSWLPVLFSSLLTKSYKCALIIPRRNVKYGWRTVIINHNWFVSLINHFLKRISNYILDKFGLRMVIIEKEQYFLWEKEKNFLSFPFHQ